jgi:hypothetical protein
MVQQMAIYDQGCKLLVSVPLSNCPNKWNNIFRQDAGQNALCSGRQVSDMRPLQLKRLSSIISAMQTEPSFGMASAKVV